jgi:hypothetical protein
MRVVSTHDRGRVVLGIVALAGLGLLAGFILAGLRPHETRVGAGDTSVS